MLSDSYVRLSLLYKERLQEERWIPKERDLDYFVMRFKQSVDRSKEQLSIILELTVKEQEVQGRIYRLLAKRYRELGMQQEEASALEALLSHQPEDEEALFLLGKSYFELGKHAKGLELYQKLERLSSSKAPGLIQLYEAFHAYHFRSV
jgi:tetratricopeptide (TPR) repeat protein